MLRRLLPQDCVLCGRPDADALLCRDCQADLVPLPDEHCSLCALPTPAGATCGECLCHTPNFDATYAALVYAYPLDGLVQAFKYGHQLALSDYFARRMCVAPPPRADVMMPLPLSMQRLRERGFNQAAELAKPLARALRMPLDMASPLRVTDTAAQASLPWKQRRANVRHAFECRADLSGKSVVVIDDVMTTGATLDEFAATLKRQGAVRVTNWVLARTLKHEY